MSGVDVVTNIPLDPLVAAQGVEPTAAKGEECVFFTGGRAIWLSRNGGKTFDTRSGPASIFPGVVQDFFGDQSVIWVPAIGRFIWVMLHGAAGSPTAIRLAYTGAEDMRSSLASHWAWVDVDPAGFDLAEQFDYPQLAVGEGFLYLTAHLATPETVVGAICMRIALQDLVSLDPHALVVERYISRTSRNFGLAQRCGTAVFFASHERLTNVLRVFRCDERTTQSASSTCPCTGMPRSRTGPSA